MGTVRIVAISDLHGHIPPDVPECDLLLIAGDIGYGDIDQSRKWLASHFADWLLRQPAKEIVATWGNHDWIGNHPWMVPELPWHVLVDQVVTLFGLKIYGSPWQPTFFNWAFNLNESDLARKWSFIPDDTDILLLHGPPRGYGDLTADGVRTGSPSLAARIREVRPTLTVCGHIHEAHGVYDLDGVTVANVSLLDEKYRMVNQPFRAELSVP